MESGRGFYQISWSHSEAEQSHTEAQGWHRALVWPATLQLECSSQVLHFHPVFPGIQENETTHSRECLLWLSETVLKQLLGNDWRKNGEMAPVQGRIKPRSAGTSGPLGLPPVTAHIPTGVGNCRVRLASPPASDTEGFSKGHHCLKTLVVIQYLYNSLFQEDVPAKPPLLILPCLLL